MVHQRIADLTVDEFKDLIREVVTQTMLDALADPDKGLELHEDMRSALQRSLSAVEAGGETIPAEQVAVRLGLEW